MKGETVATVVAGTDAGSSVAIVVDSGTRSCAVAESTPIEKRTIITSVTAVVFMGLRNTLILR